MSTTRVRAAPGGPGAQLGEHIGAGVAGWRGSRRRRRFRGSRVRAEAAGHGGSAGYMAAFAGSHPEDAVRQRRLRPQGSATRPTSPPRSSRSRPVRLRRSRAATSRTRTGSPSRRGDRSSSPTWVMRLVAPGRPAVDNRPTAPPRSTEPRGRLDKLDIWVVVALIVIDPLSMRVYRLDEPPRCTSTRSTTPGPRPSSSRTGATASPTTSTSGPIRTWPSTPSPAAWSRSSPTTRSPPRATWECRSRTPWSSPG